MNLKSLLLITSLTTGFVGCNELKGRISVNESLSLNTKKGVRVIAPGEYDSTLTIERKNKKDVVKVEISLKGKDNNPKISIPLKNGIPSHGNISMPAAEMGQNFNVLGQYDVDISRSAPVSSTESCSELVPRRRCSVSPDGQRQCRIEHVSVSGSRQVEYYLKYTTRTVDLDLTDAETNSRVIASSHNRRTDSEQINLYTGPCHLRPLPPFGDDFGLELR